MTTVRISLCMIVRNEAEMLPALLASVRGLVDEITAYVAPMIFGGANAPTLADSLGVARGEAVLLELKQVNPWDDGGIVIHYQVKRSE